MKKAGVQLVARLLPPLYMAYMRLVVATSRVVRSGVEEMFDARRRGTNVVLAVLHQGVVLSPYLFRDEGIVTLANVGDAGDLIANVLTRCGFEVLRGGSSRRRSRRTPAVRDMIACLVERARGGAVIAAVTPDGSQGPAGAVKPGLVFLSMRTAAEIYCLNVHSRRALYAPTWDRTAIPLPFSTLHVELDGPIPVPERCSRAELERIRADVETRLHALHARAFRRWGGEPLPPLATLDDRPAGV
jgi:hypothetical protein